MFDVLLTWGSKVLNKYLLISIVIISICIMGTFKVTKMLVFADDLKQCETRMCEKIEAVDTTLEKNVRVIVGSAVSKIELQNLQLQKQIIKQRKFDIEIFMEDIKPDDLKKKKRWEKKLDETDQELQHVDTQIQTCLTGSLL